MATEHFDIVIGYHVSDLEFVEKLSEKLRQADLTVWFNNPDGNPSLTSDQILGSKIFLPVMTEQSATDKRIQEQLSLAYISNSAIYPLSKIRFRFLSPKLSAGVKLMLAKINWCFVFNMDEFDTKMDAVIKSMKSDLQNMAENPGPGVEGNMVGLVHTHGMTFSSHLQALGGDSSEFDGVELSTDLSSIQKDSPFWIRHFGIKLEVAWGEFQKKFLQDYGDTIEKDYPDFAGEKKKSYVLNLMYKDIFLLKQVVRKKEYERFIGSEDKPHAFFNKVQEYVVAYMSLREVFSMDSSLRITTIQSLGQYSFPTIVSGLSDMLRDEDPNIRAVAAIALAHAGKGSPSTVDKLISIIEDEDRLVRESACLSLGYLKSAKSVPYIQNRWRNDPISTVREAAELALSKMDTPDAKRSIKVTQVLSSEMKALKPQVEKP